jgi:hypothetical protein
MTFAAVWAFLKSIPREVWYLIAFLALVWAAIAYGDARGSARVQADWDESIERGRAEIAKLRAKANEVTVKVETKYVETVKEIKVKGEVIRERVPVYIPAAADSSVPNGFVWLYQDSVHQTTIPRPADAPYGAPSGVALSTVAEVTADNFTACHVNAARLAGLQDWVREHKKLNP